MTWRRLAAAAARLLAADAGRAAGCDAPYPLSHRDPLLQAGLDRALARSGFGEALARKELAVALVDLSRSGVRYYAGANDDHMLYAASLPKIGILLGVVEALERGDATWDDSFPYKLRKMITISSNEYATWGAELVGLRSIARVMVDPRYCLYEGGVGGLWVGRAYRKGGESYRDPLRGISHGATARQVARFYVLLDAEQLVTPHWSRRYVLVGLARHVEGERWLRELAIAADDLVEAGAHRRWNGSGRLRSRSREGGGG